MTPQERQMVDDLFDRLATLENSPRDPDAERAVLDGLRHAGIRDWREGVRAGKVDAAQASMFEELERAVADVVEVDSFDPAELTGKRVAQG